MSDVFPLTEVQLMLDAWLAAEAATPFISLFEAPGVLTEATALGSLTIIDETWSAPVAGVYGERYLDAGGRPRVTMVSKQFNWTAADGAGPSVVTGYAVTDAEVATKLLHAALLASPKTMSNVNHSLIVQPTLALPVIAA